MGCRQVTFLTNSNVDYSVVDYTRVVPVATPTSTRRVNHNSFLIRGYLHVLRRTRFFLLDLARVQVLPSAATSREEPRNAVCNANGMCITFSLSRQAENVSPPGRTEEEHERASHF